MQYTSRKVEQLTVFIQNRPGILADLCAHLSERGVNIRAMSTLDNSDTGCVRIVVDETELAREVLLEAEVPFVVTEVLSLEMPNHPGGFAGMARILFLAGINIEYIYASSCPDSSKAVGIFAVDDLERAVQLDWDAR
jgi:hypothetical protein